MIRPGLRAGFATAATALVLPAASAAGAERCCFLVDARVSGTLSLASGADLEAPGASAFHARWRWRVRHVVRYVEHGRIFNALTQVGSATRRELSIRLSESHVSLRGATCRRRAARELTGGRIEAYVSLEDTTDGRIALVVRAEHPALAPRCRRTPALPTAHLRPAPAGVLLRRSRALSLSWRDPIRLRDGQLVGSVEVRVRLVAIPPGRAAGALRPAARLRLSPGRSGARLAAARAHAREGRDREAAHPARGRGATGASRETSGRGLGTSRTSRDDGRRASGGSR